jgi:hypothetical protein
MAVLLKSGVTEQNVLTIIQQSIEETIANALVKPSDAQVNNATQEATTMVEPFTNFIKYHIEYDNKVGDDTYTRLLVEKFYAFLNTVKESLEKTRRDKLVWLTVMFAALAPFRQFQRDAEQLQDEDLIFALNRLELDFLTMMNESRKQP